MQVQQFYNSRQLIMVEFYLHFLSAACRGQNLLYYGLTRSNSRLPQKNRMRGIETNTSTKRLLWSRALLRMGDHRLPKRGMSGELDNAGKRGSRGKEKEWTVCVAEDLRLFGSYNPL